MEYIIKDPDSVINYGWDWLDVLKDGEAITTSSWIIDPLSGLNETASSIEDAVTSTTFSGGVLGKFYIATNRITTSLGFVHDRSFRFQIKQL